MRIGQGMYIKDLNVLPESSQFNHYPEGTTLIVRYYLTVGGCTLENECLMGIDNIVMVEQRNLVSHRKALDNGY